MLKTMIVDDEAPARSELRYLLDELGQTEIVAEAAAETVIENPDPAFVDISEHVFRRAAGVRIGKMNDFHAPDISPSCFRLAIPPCRTGIDE